MVPPISIVLVFMGGGLGSCCRWYLSLLLEQSHPYFPWGTLVANLMSCVLLGILLSRRMNGTLPPPAYWLLGVGFCGGFSTFSTFSGELVYLLQQQQTGWALIYLSSSLIVGLLGVLIGMWIGKLS